MVIGHVKTPCGRVIQREYASLDAQGVTIPSGGDADQLLNRIMLPRIADAKWGDAGFYRTRALLDPEVKVALEALPGASSLAGK